MKQAKNSFDRMIKSRWAGALLMIAATCYTLWYLSFSNPMRSEGALSIIGLSHPFLFFIWGVLAELALYFNIEQAYRRAGYQNRWGRRMLNLAVTSILITLLVPFDYNHLGQYIFHCYGAISFIIYNGTAMLILFFRFYKKKSYLAAGCLSASILCITLLLFLILGESGILEAAPMLLSFLILCIVNTSSRFYIKKHPVQEEKEKELIFR